MENELNPKHTHNQGQTNQQGDNAQNNFDAGSQDITPQNNKGGDNISIHNDGKAADYLYKLLEKRDLTIQEKDRLIQELQEKLIKDASLVAEIKAKLKEQEERTGKNTASKNKKSKELRIAGLVVMVGGALVVTYLPVSKKKKSNDYTISGNNKIIRP